MKAARGINKQVSLRSHKALFAKTSDWSWAIVCQHLVSRVAKDLETEMEEVMDLLQAGTQIKFKHLIFIKQVNKGLNHKQIHLNSKLFYWMLSGPVLSLLVSEPTSKDQNKINKVQMSMGATSELEQTLGDSGGQGSLACCSPWGHKESDTI